MIGMILQYKKSILKFYAEKRSVQIAGVSPMPKVYRHASRMQLEGKKKRKD